MAVNNIFDKKVAEFNEKVKQHLQEEMFGKDKLNADFEWELLSIDDIATLLDISEDDAKFLFNAGVFKTYRVGNEYRAKRKSVEEKEKVINAALGYRDKNTITVPDLGKILNIGKTAVYRLVNKCYFKSYIVCGEIRIDVESFDEWYASQFHYKKIDGERPGKKYGDTMNPTTIGKVLGIPKSVGLDLLNNGKIEYIVVDGKRRVPKENFWKWYSTQDKYKIVRSIEEVEKYVY